jgi:hypothetical protein
MALGPAFGVQVERATLGLLFLDRRFEPDLGAVVARLSVAGIPSDSSHDATSPRVLTLADRDGSRVIFAGS